MTDGHSIRGDPRAVDSSPARLCRKYGPQGCGEFGQGAGRAGLWRRRGHPCFGANGGAHQPPPSFPFPREARAQAAEVLELLDAGAEAAGAADAVEVLSEADDGLAASEEVDPLRESVR